MSKRNPIAKALRSPHLAARVEPSQKDKSLKRDCWNRKCKHKKKSNVLQDL